MTEPTKSPTEFDAYAGDYAELIRDPIRDRFAASSRFFFERKLEIIQAFYRRQGMDTRKHAWLDVGCGQGDLMKVAAAHFKSVAGCDRSQEMLKACSPFEVRHQVADEQLPFEDSRFDFATVVCVYHHVPEEERLTLTRDVMRTLKPGGVMCIIEHNPLNPVTRLIVSRTPVDADAHLLRAREAQRLLLAAGARILDSRYFLYFPQSIYRLLAPAERLLSSVPLGGQYGVFAQK